MRKLFLIFSSLGSIVFSVLLSVAASAATTPYAVIKADYGLSPLYISAVKIAENGAYEYIDVYNNSDVAYDASATKIKIMYQTPDEEVECTMIAQTGYILPGHYVSYTSGANNDGYQTSCAVPELAMSKPYRLELIGDNGVTKDAIIQQITFDVSSMGQRLLWKSRPADKTNTTSVLDSTDILAHRGLPSLLYHPYDTLDLRIVEILAAPKLCSIGEVDLSCQKYVKVVNDGAEPVDLSKLRLRSGNRNTSQSYARLSYLDGIINPGQYVVLHQRVDDTDTTMDIANEGAVWFEDAYVPGIVYANNIIYDGAELAANVGKTWAYDASDPVQPWKWGVPSPNTRENSFPTVGMGALEPSEPADTRVPCKEGQYRSEETGRCRTIAVSTATVLKPCAIGQYRSEETGRCRSLLTDVAKAIKPCDDDQFRNPATGRCKQIAALDDINGLKPCEAGQERNPLTNRCRKVVATSMPKADFPVQPIKQVATSFVGWWALGGVLLLAAGYGIWEWRTEIAQLIRRATLQR